MLKMKWLLFAVFILTFFNGYCNAANCTATNLQTVKNCYDSLFLNQLDFSFPYLAPNYVEDLKAEIATSEGVIQRCRQQKTFRNCLKQDTSNGDVVENCVNVNDFLRLGITRNVTKWAKQYVTSFIELDYICGDGYNIFSYATDCINQIPPKCIAQVNATEAEDYDCQYHEEYIKCMKETAEQECGDAAGCFAEKDSMISVCYGDTNCTYCEDLDYNDNFYGFLCDSDANFTAPSTTTAAPTTSTPEATTSAGGKFTWTFLILFFSFTWSRSLKTCLHS